MVAWMLWWWITLITVADQDSIVTTYLLEHVDDVHQGTVLVPAENAI